MSNFELFTDGSTRPTNPGPSGYGAALFRDDELVATSSGYLGDSVTNNQAEYSALVAGLFMAEKYMMPGDELKVRSDSMLVINQVSGSWKIGSGNLQRLYARARNQVSEFRDRGVAVALEHVKGHAGILGNETVDYLAGQAVAKQDPPMSWLRALVSGEDKPVPKPLLPVLKGHEKLKELVSVGLRRRGHQVITVPSLELIRSRDGLKRTNEVTGSILASLPELVTIINGKAYMLLLATGYRVDHSDPGVLTVNKEALEACRVLAGAGLTVLILHKPHGSGRWKRPYDLAWSDSLDEIPIMCFEMEKLSVIGEYNMGEWPASVALDQEGAQEFAQYVEGLEG